jgi:para-aminobenzoate synthetase component 1
LFIISFDGKEAIVLPLDDIRSNLIKYAFVSNQKVYTNVEYRNVEPIELKAVSIPYEIYETACAYIQNEQYNGESYLANLTFPSRIISDLTLENLFYVSHAPYKLFYTDEKIEFSVFSPERFVTIADGKISTCPMKGTLKTVENFGAETLLNDIKEQAEHITIVDLLRNDLALVCSDVEVLKYRYVDTISTETGFLYQTSSLIEGELTDNYREHPAQIFEKLLPAGSVTGAPKKRTLEIIKKAEGYERGFYTGIFGIIDNKTVDSAVMIRFAENRAGSIYYKSGGGITIYSDPEKEYQELKDKIYVPVC